MLIKEYRICMPLSVEEYRVAQLYMIQKKSKNETTGQGSGVEIIKNEPYTNGPGGSGQYTFKIYHIDKHLPGWFRNILPKSAMVVEEEAWNAYPYTRTKYKVPIIEKFSLDLETHYFNDAGEQDNVFVLNEEDRKNRIVDFLDMVADPISPTDYKKEEDPKIFVSSKSNRGPLTDEWRTTYRSSQSEESSNRSMMCAYKLCRVEFRYWGMQTKIEKFIDDVALRKTMLRAHRQVWCWQDEWIGLTIDDIRQLESDTAKELFLKMHSSETVQDSIDIQNAKISSESASKNVKKMVPDTINEPITNKNTNNSSAEKESVSFDSDEEGDENFFDALNELESDLNCFVICQSTATDQTLDMDQRTE